MTNNGQTVNIELPEAIFRRLQHIAEVTQRSVEDVLATTVNAALPQTPDVPADVADDLAALSLFSDAALWAATKTSLPLDQYRRLNQLADEGKNRQLNDVEAAELTQLIDRYDRAVLRRAKALALLAQRGFDIASAADIKSHPDAGS